MFYSVFTILFPKFCTGCNKIGTLLCQNCFQKVELNSSPVELDDDHCLDDLITAAFYRFPIKNLIRELKYKSVKEAGIIAARFLYYTTHIPTTDCITAVPLHPERQKTRGFNQAEIIAQELARLLETPYYPLLKRVVHTTNQATLKKEERIHNIKNQFIFNSQHQQIAVKKILIVDDVITTGSTLNECARTIKNSLNVAVYGCCVAFRG